MNQNSIADAARCIQQGGVIAYPTESSFGLGCDPANLTALRRLLKIKQRPADKGLIILVSQLSQASDYLLPLSNAQINDIEQPRPRATTWLIPRKPDLPIELCGTHSKLAVRLTQHPMAKALCEQLGYPLVSTSCNLSNQQPLMSAQAIIETMGSQLDFVLDGDLGGQAASQIIDWESGQILRD